MYACSRDMGQGNRTDLLCRKPNNLLFLCKTSIEYNMNNETFLEQGMRQIRCHFFQVLIQIFKAEDDKTNKRTCAPSEISDQPGYPPSLI